MHGPGLDTDFDLALTSPPAVLLTTAEAKAQCRVDHSDDDAYLDTLISAVSDLLDGPRALTGRALVTQSWQMTSGPVSARAAIFLPVVPFISLTSISYLDRDGQSQSLNVSTDVTTQGATDWCYVCPVVDTNWPAMASRSDALTITWSAGYGAASDVPAAILMAAKAMVSHWYNNRDAVSDGSFAEVPLLVDTLLAKDRLGWIGG